MVASVTIIISKTLYNYVNEIYQSYLQLAEERQRELSG